MATGVLTSAAINFTSDGATSLFKIAPSAGMATFSAHGGSTVQLKGVTGPLAATDAATKGYVDNALNGLHWKRAVAGVGITKIAGAYTLSDAGKTLTADTDGVFSGTPFGHPANPFTGSELKEDPSEADNLTKARLLLLNQQQGGGSAFQNGLWYIHDKGSGGTPWILKRPADMDHVSEVMSSAVLSTAGHKAGQQLVCTNTSAPSSFEAGSIDFTELSTNILSDGSVTTAKLATTLTLGTGGAKTTFAGPVDCKVGDLDASGRKVIAATFEASSDERLKAETRGPNA